MWTRLGDHDLSGHSLSLSSNSDGTLELVLAASDGAIALLRQSTPGGWAGAAWTLLKANFDANALALGRNPDGRLEIAAVARGQVQSLAQSAPGEWLGSSWQQLRPGPVVAALALSSAADGQLHIFVAGTDNGVYESVKTGSGAWGAWQPLGTPARVFTPEFAVGPGTPSPTASSRVVATTDAQGRVALFTAGLGDAVYTLGQSRTGTWENTNWYELISSGSIQALAIGQNRDGRMEVAALDPAGVALIAQTAPGEWTGARLGALDLGRGKPDALAPSMERNADGTLDVFCSVQDDGSTEPWSLLHARQQAPGGWPAQQVKTERLAALPEGIVETCAGHNADGRLEVLLLTSRRVLHVGQLLPNVWTTDR